MTEDLINHPSHYNQYEFEVCELTCAMGFSLGNAVKYILRAPYKGDEVSDLQKAVWYINNLLAIPAEERCRQLLRFIEPELIYSFDNLTVANLIRACELGNSDILYMCREHLENRIKKLVDERPGQSARHPEKIVGK